MHERAQRILNEARETLARTADITVEHHDSGEEYWKRPDEPKPAPEKASNARLLTDAETLRWKNYIRDEISAAIAGRDQYWRAVIGKLVEGLSKKWRSEFSEGIGLLRADIEIQTKAAQRREAEIIDLPAILPMGRRRHG